MLRRKLAESLTIRIFLITVLLLLGAGTVTFGLIAWATPSTYTAVVNDDLTRQTDRLVEKLADTDLADSGLLLGGWKHRGYGFRACGADSVWSRNVSGYISSARYSGRGFLRHLVRL